MCAINALQRYKLICKWGAVYIERCKYGSGASIWKPAMATWQGAGCLANLDVTGSVGLFGSPMSMAEEISRRIKFELGITASIGVADNKISAKLGSDYRKPDTITRIEADNYKEIAYPLPVSDLLYVGPATERKLHSLGISTIGQLAECPLNCLTYKLGKETAAIVLTISSYSAADFSGSFSRGRMSHCAALKSHS